MTGSITLRNHYPFAKPPLLFINAGGRTLPAKDRSTFDIDR